MIGHEETVFHGEIAGDDCTRRHIRRRSRTQRNPGTVTDFDFTGNRGVRSDPYITADLC